MLRNGLPRDLNVTRGLFRSSYLHESGKVGDLASELAMKAADTVILVKQGRYPVEVPR